MSNIFFILGKQCNVLNNHPLPLFYPEPFPNILRREESQEQDKEWSKAEGLGQR